MTKEKERIENECNSRAGEIVVMGRLRYVCN